MLPKRLELRNFLAYRAPEPIIFEGVELACLTGQNGVGKSSILDAITWALWGKARAKRDEDLIHLGQDEMQAQLDFEQEGARYRVNRRRSRAGRGSRGSLDLLVWGEDELPRLINEDGLRRTQEKINQILRLDYETFVHSAYLQQGRAAAFTLKTPAERKRILSDILGLEQWAAYEEAVKERLTELHSQIEILNHDLERIDEEIAQEPQLQAQLDQVMATLATTNETLDQASEQYAAVVNSATALQRARENMAEQHNLIENRQEDLALLETEIARQGDKIAEYQQTIDQSETIEAGYQQLLEARASQSAIAEQLAQKQEIDQRYHQLERALAEKQAALLREADVLRERVRSLEKQQASASDSDTSALQAELHSLTELDTQREQRLKDVQKLKERRSAARTRLNTLKDEGLALNERLLQLQEAEGATCPLCGQALTAEHRETILAGIEAERDQLRQEYRDCNAEIQHISEQRAGWERDLEALALQLKDLPALQQRLGAATEQQRKAEEAENALQLERSQLEQIETRLAQEDYAEENRRQLAQVEEQRQRIAYDPASHADIKTQLETYDAYDRQHNQLEFAKINLPEAQRSLDEADARLQQLGETLANDQDKLERITLEIEQLESKVEEESKWRAELERIRAEAQRLNESKTIHQQGLKAIEQGRARKQRLNQRRQTIEERRSLLNELRAAFGRNGLPAMIIETAIPELEAEANELLARMTDGRMTLRFNTQRERVAGGMTETLDIEISDELGGRSYELYSGGEAFRINFAIRIALSKMLARRAGAHLRALFIDEGFGSQDEDGRGKLVDAINKIASDFDLILVITHIDELRDSFPVHLLVEKTASGSLVTLQ